MRVSDDLKRGKANLQKWGWTQGLIHLNTGGVCAIGALMSDLDHEFFLNGSRPVGTASIRAQHLPAVRYLERAVPVERQYLTLWSYNDHWADQAAIEALYDRAIALAEADEAQAKVNEMIAEAEAWVNNPPPVEISKIPVDTLVGAC